MFIPVGIDRPLVRIPYMATGIAAVNIVVHVTRTLTETSDNTLVAYGFVAGEGSILTLFTHMFLHAGWGHLIGNLIFFGAVGVKLEDALGHIKFLLFYLGCGVLATMTHVMLSGNIPIPLVGASGAISGVMGGFVMLYPLSRVHVLFPFFIRVLDFFMPALIFFGFYIAKELLFLYFAQQSGGPAGVAFGAHVGGFFAGVIWAWAFVGWNQGDELDEFNMSGGRSREASTEMAAT